MKEQNRMGRGIIKWQPFASIPQQFAGVRNIIEDQRKVPQPILDEGEQERLNYLLQESVEVGNEVTLVFWSNGYLHNIIGYINKVDQINHSFQFLTLSNQLRVFSFDVIVDIKII
jgi:YolD-like protein